MNRSYYAIIPAEVRYDKKLPPNAKLLYGEITALCNEKGFCWAKNSYFAELYEVTNVTISRWIAALKEKGYIEIFVSKEEGNKRYIGIGGMGAINKIVNRSKQNSQEVLTKLLIGHNKNVNTPNLANKDGDKDTGMKKSSNTTTNNTTNNTSNSSSTTEEKSEDLIDEDFKELASIYQECGFKVNGLTPNWMSDIKKEYGFEWCKNAFLIAEKRGKLTKSYVEGILENWHRGGGMKLGGGKPSESGRKSNEDELGQYEDIGISL